jgi:sialidase-1
MMLASTSLLLITIAAAAVMGTGDAAAYAAAASTSCLSELAGVKSCVDVFTKGESVPGRLTGQNAFRIPGLVYAEGVGLFAFVESYTRNCHPEWNPFKSIAMKKSTDAGKSFGNVSIAADPKVLWPRADNSSLWDPTPTWDAQTRTLFLTFSREHGNPNSQLAHCRNGESSCRDLWTMTSTDEGRSFSAPLNITAQIGWPALGTNILTAGGGSGIQLPSGRLVVPVYSGSSNTTPGPHLGSSTLLSDDHGKSWRLGAAVGDTRLCEPTVVRAFGGPNHLIMNMRLENACLEKVQGHCTRAEKMDCGVGGPQHCRAQSHSTDGGESWSPRLPVPSLPDPQIKGGIDRWPQRGGGRGDGSDGTLVFANAAGVATGQINTHLTISLSSDNGKTWPRKKLLWKGGTGYTVLQYVGNDTAAVFYSRDGKCGVAMTVALVDLTTLGAF